MDHTSCRMSHISHIMSHTSCRMPDTLDAHKVGDVDITSSSNHGGQKMNCHRNASEFPTQSCLTCKIQFNPGPKEKESCKNKSEIKFFTICQPLPSKFFMNRLQCFYHRRYQHRKQQTECFQCQSPGLTNIKKLLLLLSSNKLQQLHLGILSAIFVKCGCQALSGMHTHKIGTL